MQGKCAKPALKIPLNSLLLTWNTPPTSQLPHYTHTHTHARTHTRLQPFAFPFFPKQACILLGKNIALPFIFLHQSMKVAVSAIPLFSLLHPSIQRFLSDSPLPLSSVWTHLAPGNKQRRVCVRGGRDGVPLSEGTMLLLVALNLKLLLFLCLSFSDKPSSIHFHWGKQHLRYSTISLLHQTTCQCSWTTSDSNFRKILVLKSQ